MTVTLAFVLRTAALAPASVFILHENPANDWPKSLYRVPRILARASRALGRIGGLAAIDVDVVQARSMVFRARRQVAIAPLATLLVRRRR